MINICFDASKIT